MYKYVFKGPGSINIKTPHVEKFSDIKIDLNQFPDHVENHSEYPNGLILDITEYADRIEYLSNKKLIVLEDFSIAFED